MCRRLRPCIYAVSAAPGRLARAWAWAMHSTHLLHPNCCVPACFVSPIAGQALQSLHGHPHPAPFFGRRSFTVSEPASANLRGSAVSPPSDPHAAISPIGKVARHDPERLNAELLPPRFSTALVRWDLLAQPPQHFQLKTAASLLL